MPGSTGQLRALWKQIIGGIAPSGAASSTGDISQMVKYLVANMPSGSPVPVMLGTADPNLSIGVNGATSLTWPAANRALFIPFQITQSVTVVKMWLLNGATVSGNFDIGIYDAAYVRKVSKGSTAQAGTSVLQEVDVADTVLDPGRYYLALCFDNTTATVQGSTGSGSENARSRGVFQQDVGSVTLPATATPASLSSTGYPPNFGLSLRTLI